MTDKELLELAARAAGIAGEWVENYGTGDYYYCGNTEGILFEHSGGGSSVWNPLTDDGDAFRLAVALNLFNHPLFAHFLALERFANQDQDDCTAHRRAITRAAAAIGKEME